MVSKIITKNLNPSLLVVPVLFIFLMITHWKTLFVFFLQDEWMGFGLIILNGTNIILRGLGGDHVIHFVPINNLLNFLAFNIFNLTSIFYNIAGLSFHFLNSFLVYQIALSLFKNKKYALLSAIIFITSAISSQLIMWPLISLNILSLTFTLIVWRLTLKYYQNKNLKRLSLMIALFTLLTLLTLEYSLGLLIFVPFVVLLTKKKDIKKAFVFLIPFMLVICFYLVIRMLPPFVTLSKNNVSQSFDPSILAFKILRFPVRYLGQLFVSDLQILSISDLLSTKFNLAKEIFYSKITFCIGAFILCLNLYLLVIKRQGLKNNFRNLLIILAFILSSSLPFILIPGQAGDFLLFPPRYLYYGLVGSSMLLVLLLQISETHKNLLLKLLVGGIITITIVASILENNYKANKLYNQSIIRKNILKIIKDNYPVLPKNVVFYINSDISYYGLPFEEKILPFQSGLGQTLLVWYQEKEKFPKEFFQNKFLWEITQQGYKEAGRRGFGYFRDFELLKNAIKQYNIPLNSVIAFSWYSGSQSLVNTTDRIQNQLKSEPAK